MPRGRHRHSPPLHRLLPPTAIAGVSLVCALGPWVFSEPAVLRVTAAVAAATAAVGAAVMRRWDVEAGKRVADLTRARASDEWRHEEKVAEVETDLEESRELRTKLEHKLRAKRAELANLRNEHAALLRRYATAETERASALEGRRLLEIEATVPDGARALPAGGADTAEETAAAQASPVPPQGVPVQGAPWGARGAAGGPETESSASEDESDDEWEDGAERLVPAAFSPAGSALFLRANSALERIITQRASAKGSAEGSATGSAEVSAEGDTDAEVVAEAGSEAVSEAVSDVEAGAGAGAEIEVEPEAGAEALAETETETEAAVEAEPETGAEDANEVGTEAEIVGGGDEAVEVEAEGVEVEDDAAEEVGSPDAQGGAKDDAQDGAKDDAQDGAKDDAQGGAKDDAQDGAGSALESADGHEPADRSGDASGDVSADELAKERSSKGGSGKHRSPKGDPDGPNGGGTRQGRPAEAEPVPAVTAEEDDPVGKSGAVDGHEHAAAEPVPAAPVPAQSELPTVRPQGHFTVPTAVAVVPAAPRRRPSAEGGFDFFGTQKGADAIEAVQNEDLADVVGQEALALHKAESEARFKRVDEASRGVGQVIDLTAHDETEQIDVQGLRTAAS